MSDCPAAENGKHTWTQDFLDFAVGDGVFTREHIKWRCKHCGMGANDPDEIEYRQLLDSVISETFKEGNLVPRANSAVQAIDREIKAADRDIQRQAVLENRVAARIMELDELRQRYAIEHDRIAARLEALQAARDSLVDKAD